MACRFWATGIEGGLPAGSNGKGGIMRRCGIASVVMCLILTSLCAAQPVYFADTNLKAAVMQALGLTHDPNDSDMVRLTMFLPDNRGITDLTGLEYATNLTTLSLGGNAITDLDPLAGLTNLTWLYLYGNRIVDLGPLAGLTNLTSLTVHGNQIATIPPLDGLTKLEYLQIGNNPLTDISGVAGMSSLKTLIINETQVTDLRPLSGLTSLQGLNLFGGVVSDISPLAGLRNLTSLNLQYNQVSDLGPLAALTGLTSLNVSSDHLLNDLTPLARLVNLTDLRLQETAVMDIRALTGLTHLTALDLQYNRLGWKAQCSEIPAIRANNPGITIWADLNPYDCGIPDVPAPFADPALKTAVREALGLTRDPNTSDMVWLNLLWAGERGIISLSGLEYATNLTGLYVGSNAISDLTPLAGLTRLGELDLWGNRIVDLSPLAGLTNLTWMNLSYNQISNTSALAGLVNLRSLNLAGNQITAISPMDTMTGLTDLVLQGNPLTDLSGLAGVSHLRRLNLSRTPVTDLGPLSGLTSLESLEACCGAISDISSLAGLTNLQYLDLSHNQINNISLLAGLTKLNWLNLYSNQATDIGALTDLKDLTFLDLGDNVISDVSPLSGLTNLTSLNLSGHISDITPLAGLTKLTSLGIIGEVTDVSPLAAMTDLTILDLGYNRISDVNPLGNLTALVSLSLIENQSITDISALSALTNLRWLYIVGNQINDISALTAMTHLAGLYMDGNPLPATVCTVEIPLIRQNNPGIAIGYAPCPQTFTLTVSSSAGGSVVLPGEGAFQFGAGNVAAIEAVLARSSSRFTGWAGSAVTAGRVADPLAMKTTVMVDADYALEATFAEQETPATGFSLGTLSMDNAVQFSETVATDNTSERTFVEYVTGAGPDPSGMMRMQPVEGEPAVAKGSFGRSEANDVLVRFSYLFERATPGSELIVYLSDVPQLLNRADPNWAQHYVAIGRIVVPPEGRPGSIGSGRVGTFEQWVSAGMLNIHGGLWVELVLADSGRAVSSSPTQVRSVRLASVSGGGCSVLIDDWAVEVHCSGICMDLNWSDTADEEDFLLVIASCGRSTGLDEGGVGSRTCLEGAFSEDGYVDVFDVESWDWALKDSCRCACGSFCRIPLPLTDAAGAKSRTSSPLGAPSDGWVHAAGGVPEGLLILGKKKSTIVFKDGFYSFAEDASYLGAYTHAALSDRCNLRLVRGPSGQLYVVDSETGVVQLGSAAKTVIPAGRATCANEPRYHQAATVYVGIQGASSNAFGRPILDVAFDSMGNAYVVPVVVQPAQSPAYVAAAQLQLQPKSNPPYQVAQLYDDPPLPGDNQLHENVREIEVDGAGNVYVLNAQSLNEGDILFKYRPDGTVQRRNLAGPDTAVKIRDPIALHVSTGSGVLYLASAQRNADAPDAATVYGLAADDLSPRRTLTVRGLQYVTDIAEEPMSGRLYVAGFSMTEPVPQYPNPLAPPFYYPCLAALTPDVTEVDAALLAGSGSHDLVLPVSLVWTGATP